MIPASQNFINTMIADVNTLYARINLLDKNENVIQQIDTAVIDGQIDIDRDSPARRKMKLTVDNTDGSFTWSVGGLIWIDKKIQLFIGLETPTGIEYVPMGVFMLSAPTVTSRADGTREVTLQGDDKWHQFDGQPLGTFQYVTTIQAGVLVTDAIKTLAQQFGETKFAFDACDVTVPYTLTYQPGEAVGKAIKELADLAVYSVYYDVNGYLRFRPQNQNLTASASTWTYDKSEFTLYAGADRTFDESKLYNSVFVIGGSSQTGTVSASASITDPNNPISTVNIGTRLFVYNNGNPDPLITTTALAQARANYELTQRARIIEQQKFSALPNYLQEAEDVVTVVDDWTGTDGLYQIVKLSIPLKPGELMTGECWRVYGVGV
jgi:hypothetical protein